MFFGDFYLYSKGSNIQAYKAGDKGGKEKEIRNLKDYETFELVKDYKDGKV